MATEGPRSPGTTGNDATVGTADWLNPGNITTSNDTYANVSGANTSKYLTGTNFGFASVTGTVDGILAEIEQSKVNGGIENAVRLIIGGTITGNNKSTGATLPDADTYVSYGGSADLWGTTPTPANITASTFGVGFSTTGGGAAANRRVDHMRVTVTYTAAAVASAGGIIFIGLLFGLIRFLMVPTLSEPLIRFLLRTVIPSEKRVQTCSARGALACAS